MKNELLWKPTQKRVESTSLFEFIKHINTRHKERIDNDPAVFIVEDEVLCYKLAPASSRGQRRLPHTACLCGEQRHRPRQARRTSGIAS